MAIKGEPWSENRRIEKKTKTGKKIEQLSIHIVRERIYMLWALLLYFLLLTI
jgi:hypothetical protein